MEIQMGIVTGVVIIIFLAIVAVLWARGEEMSIGNNVFCSACRSYWARCSTDSVGGRGYNCVCVPVCRIWISYAVDK